MTTDENEVWIRAYCAILTRATTSLSDSPSLGCAAARRFAGFAVEDFRRWRASEDAKKAKPEDGFKVSYLIRPEGICHIFEETGVRCRNVKKCESEKRCMRLDN